MTARATKLMAALRQLACLGLPGKTALPEAIALLRELVGFDVDGTLFVNDRFDLLDAQVNFRDMVVLQDYAENFFNRPDGDGVTGMTLQQAHECGMRVVQSSRFIERRGMEETTFWNRAMRPIGMGWCCQIPLRDGIHPLANLVLMRPFTQSDFSPEQVRRAAEGQPWLSHLLAAPAQGSPEADASLVPSGDSGTAILDAQGRLLAASADALSLLHHAAGLEYSPRTVRRAAQGELQELLRSLARAVGAALNGLDTPLPAAFLRSRYGTFQVRAHALRVYSQGSPRQVSVHIERHVPLSLRLFRSPGFLALSMRERDVCLRLVAGHSAAAIARDLGIKPSSVIHHTRSLYNRLAVSSQKELVGALLASPPMPQV